MVLSRQGVPLDFVPEGMDDPEGVEREEEAGEADDEGHAVVGQEEDWDHHNSQDDT